jgi:hypothetical protein
VKQYIYGPEVIGLAQWPSGTLRLEGIDVTENPSEADLFVIPGTFSLFQDNGNVKRDMLERLPHWKGNEARHVAFDVSDYFTKAIDLPIIFLRCDVRTWMLPTDVNTIQMAWPVEDLGQCVPVPEGGFKYDISFHAWLSSNVRRYSSDAILASRRLNHDIERYPDFYGYIENEPEGKRRRKEFLRSLQESRIALCPESIPGVLPYRFFEAMSAGRVPFLISSNYVLPFADEIPYEKFCIWCSAETPSEAAAIAGDVLNRMSDADLIDAGKIARYWWEQKLDSRNWPRIMAEAVTAKLEKVAA